MRHFYIRLIGSIPFLFFVCCLSATVNTTNHYPDTAQMSLRSEKKAAHPHAKYSHKKDRFRPISQKAKKDSSGLENVVSRKQCAPCKQKEQVAIRDEDTQDLKPLEKLASPDTSNTSSYEEQDTSSSSDTSSSLDTSSYEEVGIASWYGNAFNGKITASGDVFDNTKLTAAHKTLPLGSMVQVHNLNNDKKVTLKVNDRGPFVKKRILDVSEYAAKLLGFRESGTAQVKVKMVESSQESLQEENEGATYEIFGDGDVESAAVKMIGNRNLNPESVQEDTGQNYFSLQVGSFEKLQHARTMEQHLSQYPQKTQVLHRDNTYIVLLGKFETREEATEEQEKLRKEGYNSFIREPY